MKKLISAICFLLSVVAVEAQIIHWITFIDTNDENVGKIDVLGRTVLYSHFINEVNAALAPLGYEMDIKDYFGDNVTPENCKSTIEHLQINNPDDIIVFYYIGHGGRPLTDPGYIMEHPYPQMCMQLKYPESKYIPLEWVDSILSRKGARLSVTIGMCCNSFSNISIKTGPTFSPNYGPTYMSGNKLARIQDLFLRVKGNVLATSASPDQTSGCFQSDFGVIDRYTTVLCSIFKSMLDDYNKTLTWDELLGSISAIIDNKTSGEQTPIHEVHLEETKMPQPSTPRTPGKQQIQQTKQKQSSGNTIQPGNGDEWANELTNLLGKLINVNIGEYKRIELEEDLGELFAPGAQVRILGQDSDIVIDKESADVFLGRLSTNELLLKVTVVEGSFDSNNRITSLKVRETYKINNKQK